MRILDRRVQVLLSQEQYAALETRARQDAQSVGAVIRQAVEHHLVEQPSRRQAAFAQFIELSDRYPEVQMTAAQWSQVKHLDEVAVAGYDA